LDAHNPRVKKTKYVPKKSETNELIVGTDQDVELYSNELQIKNMHFLTSPPTPLLKGEGSIKVYAKIRYRQADQECELFYKNGKYQVIFKEKQRAIASGQICAIYL